MTRGAKSSGCLSRCNLMHDPVTKFEAAILRPIGTVRLAFLSQYTRFENLAQAGRY